MRRLFPVALLFVCCALMTAVSPDRTVVDNVLTSEALPRIRVAVDPKIAYVGSFPFKIRDVAAGERFLFAETEGRRVRRMVIVQFEGFLPEVDDEYRFQVTNPVKLGAHEYRHSTWLFDNEQSVREGTDTEPGYTAKFLKSRGLKTDKELMMSRFARPVGADRRNEIIIFYFENMADHGLKLANFNEDAEPTPERIKLGNELSARSLKAFKVED